MRGMMTSAFCYIPYDEAIQMYFHMMQMNGGGLAAVRDRGRVESVLEFVQNDDYYPTFADKLAYLVYGICSGHYFADGNKRMALLLGGLFLNRNGYKAKAIVFMLFFETIVYYLASGKIDRDTFNRSIAHFVNKDFNDEDIKFGIVGDILTLLGMDLDE